METFHIERILWDANVDYVLCSYLGLFPETAALQSPVLEVLFAYRRLMYHCMCGLVPVLWPVSLGNWPKVGCYLLLDPASQGSCKHKNESISYVVQVSWNKWRGKCNTDVEYGLYFLPACLACLLNSLACSPLNSTHVCMQLQHATFLSFFFSLNKFTSVVMGSSSNNLFKSPLPLMNPM